MSTSKNTTDQAELRHKLKSSVAVISGYLQLLEERLTNEEELNWLRKAQSELEKLLKGLEDIK